MLEPHEREQLNRMEHALGRIEGSLESAHARITEVRDDAKGDVREAEDRMCRKVKAVQGKGTGPRVSQAAAGVAGGFLAGILWQVKAWLGFP